VHTPPSPAAAGPARLRDVPWRALDGLGPALDGPLADVLAGTPAERVLDRFLRAHRALGSAARAAVAEAVFGVGLWRRRLRVSVGRGDAPPRVLLAALARDLGGLRDACAVLGLAPDALPPVPAPAATLADRWSLPGWLADALEEAAGPEAVLLAAALAEPAPIALRANLLRTTRDGLAARLAAEGIPVHPGQLAPAALVLDATRANLWGTEAWREGLFEVQDEGSQLVAAVVGARQGETVLDLCAGAGGKTLGLAADVGPSGTVHAADPDPERLARLAVRARRAGAANVRIHGAAPPDDLTADRVLVDAPCSELGVLRRGPDLRWRLDPAAFAALPPLQRAILDRAARHVRPGGRLVYATCTMRRAENEDVALAFEAGHRELSRVAPGPGAPLVGADRFLRTLPHRDGADGFFAAVWERRG
jgi:16S rRNA (cytosine967-C5)-methyltransferase